MEREKERPSQLDIAKSRWSYAVTMILETFGAQTALVLHFYILQLFMFGICMQVPATIVQPITRNKLAITRAKQRKVADKDDAEN